MYWGLSPRARGKHALVSEINRDAGPIPAGAGETILRPPSSIRARAYPRGRGGNCSATWICVAPGGLSPRARGKRIDVPDNDGVMGPIPAGAGETEHADLGYG